MLEDILRRELEASFRNRADLYRLMLAELGAELGRDRAEALMARIIERRGREVGEAHFKACGPDALAVGEAFLAASPDQGRMYPTEVTRHSDGIDFRVRRCPLLDAWREAGLDDATTATLCRLAGAFDKGLFEAAGVAFENQTWTPHSGGGCCHIRLRDAGRPA
jgi:L-2-amino-thiazoline-4-carboxylic acid hydrolase